MTNIRTKKPNRTTPRIERDRLYLPDQDEPIIVASAEWFLWLEEAMSFAVRNPDYSPYLCRKERRKHGGVYWSAYRRVRNRTFHIYAGKSEELTIARLAEIGHQLDQLIAQQGQVAVVGKQRIAMPQIQTLRFGRRTVWFDLIDGRILGVPIKWFPRLQQATMIQRNQWQLFDDRMGVAWPDLDEHISIRVLMNLPS